jgi:hypothetical protein
MTVARGNILYETWGRLSRHRFMYMTVCIHVMKEKRIKSDPSKKKVTFVRYKVSNMDIDCKEHMAPKIIV